MLKRFTLFILSLVMILNCFSVAFCTFAADDTKDILVSLVKKFPDGKYWNHMGSDKNAPDKVTNTPCESHSGCGWQEGACSCNSYDNAIQCMGYAYKIANEITGKSARNFTKVTTLKASNLRVGDVIRYRNNGHSICVTGVNGTQISYTDCNWDYKCGIRWGVMDVSYIKSKGFTYVLHLDGNNRKNTDIDFYEDVKIEDSTEPEQVTGKETWQMSSDDSLNVRKSASTTASVVGSIPASAKFTVYQKKVADGYLWGKVKYNDVSGWSVLNYSQFKSGAYEKPELKDVSEKYLTRKITLNWSVVSGADKYQVNLYDKDKKIIDKYTVSDNKYDLTVSADGKYFVAVTSLSNICPSWKITGDTVSFTVKERPEGSVTELDIPFDTKTLTIDDEYAVSLTVKPENSTEEFLWESSNTDVAVVSADGVIQSRAFGTATVTCRTADGEISDSCVITVVPEKVALSQNISKTTKTSITLKWNKVEGADGYTVKKYDSSKKKYVTVATITATSYTDKTVKAGKNYNYIVTAFAEVDSKKYVSGESKITCSTDPAKVTGLKQSASSTGTVTLKWTKVTNATSYVVYKYNAKTKKYEKFKTTTGTSLKITQTAASSAKYRVRAVTKTASGNNYGDNSSVITATAGPAKMSVSLANAGKGKVKISWKKVSGATHYELYRMESGKFVKWATIGAQYGSFTNINLKSGKVYKYRMRAIKVTDKGTAYGSYSSTVSIKAK